MKWAKQKTGFTIVELLIVVVVIAILAAITIVAYNGIQDRARSAAVAAKLKQASDRIALYKVDQNTLPVQLSDIPNFSLQSDLAYWTYANNTQYCLSTTTDRGQAYYRLSTGSGDISIGACTEIGWVAGEPLAYTDIPGSNVSLSRPVTGLSDITLYVLFSIVDANFYYDGFAGMNPSQTGNRFYFQGASTGSSTAGYRIDTPAATNYTGSQANVRTPGYHIGWMQSSENATRRTFAYDSVTHHSIGTMDPGTGWNFTGMFLSTNNNPSYTPIAAVSYDAAHDQSTRTAVMNWLAKKYNTGLSY